MNKIDVRNYNDLVNRTNQAVDDETLDLCEHLFCLKLDEIFGHSTPNVDGFDDLFVLENFFPWFEGKDVGDGSWIRINTEEGYRIYYAKRSVKRMSQEITMRQLKKLKNKFRKANPNEQSLDELELSINQIDQMKALQNKLQLAEAVSYMPSDLYYVKYLKTKSQWVYLLPTEYEIISDIQLYVDAVLDKSNTKAVRYRQIFTKQDQDQVFYMQSRGIPKDVAVMMCRLQQCYFEVNVQSLFNEWMQPANIKVV